MERQKELYSRMKAREIFRRPNEMEISGFEEVWNRSTPQSDGTRLPDVVDLLITKMDTGRAKDTF